MEEPGWATAHGVAKSQFDSPPKVEVLASGVQILIIATTMSPGQITSLSFVHLENGDHCMVSQKSERLK